MAFSGGLDSTVLLHALLRADHGLPLRALHVCHHLQDETEAWAAHCQAFCACQDIAFERLDVNVAIKGEGVEAAARRARYAAFAEVLHSGEALALAHHADDQAETFLLQALRGAGVAGLAAMPETAEFAAGLLWRPFLALPRAALRDYARHANLDWIEDPSNRDRAIDRGYLREAVWPALNARWPKASTTLSRAAAWCAQAGDALEQVAAEDTARLTDAQGRLQVAGVRDLTAFRQGGLLRHWLAAGGHDSPDRRHVAQIQRLLTAREHAGPVVRWQDTEVRLFDGYLHAMPALASPPSAHWRAEWPLARPLRLPAGCGVLEASASEAIRATACVRFRRGGERLPDDASTGGSRALKTFLQRTRVPPWIRQRLPLVYIDDRLIAIGDYWLDATAARRSGVTDLRIRWRGGCRPPS